MEAILAAGHIPAAMEQFSAGDDTAWERITRWIDASDAFILILGGRYGSIEPTSGKSYVQLEYEYAVEKKKPYFALVISDAHLENWVKQEGFKVDERNHPELYGEFKKRVKHKLCAPWEDKKDIKTAILHKLPEWNEREDLVGWMRADQAVKPEVTNEIARLSQENRELRASAADSATYGGLSFESLCTLLRETAVKIWETNEFERGLGIPQSPPVSDLLDLFRVAADAIVGGRKFGAALGRGANEGLMQLTAMASWTGLTGHRFRFRIRGEHFATACCIRPFITRNAAAQQTNDHGLISVLRALHDDLDPAVAGAHGWPATLTTEEILFKLVDLNAARAAEERTGKIRWLRPEFQQTADTQTGMEIETEEAATPKSPSKQLWSATLPDRVRAVRDNLIQMPAPSSAESIARRFTRARVPDVEAILETLTALGQAHHDPAGYRS